MVGFDGTDPGPVCDLIDELALGGVILFSSNIVSSDQLTELTATLQKHAAKNNHPGKLLISIDQEGGETSRLGPGLCPEFQTNQEHGEHYARTGGTDFVIDQAGQTAGCLGDLGININLAPVVDLVNVKGNRVIGSRSYGSDPDIVSTLGCTYISELQAAGIIATAKHFPGHGPTTIDSHVELPIISLDREESERLHFYPFQKAIETGVDVIMTGHIMHEAYDDVPATLSRELLTGQHRSGLGFDGVIITDDMNMLAIKDNYTTEEAVVKAVLAGVDIVLVCSNPEVQRATHKAIYDGVKSGEIDEEIIDASVERILKLKEKYGLLS